jgi:hypothetical protein
MSSLNETAEQKRLDEARVQKLTWKKWGPYPSGRQRGTVREDHSDNGDFSHEQRTKRKFSLSFAVCEPIQILRKNGSRFLWRRKFSTGELGLENCHRAISIDKLLSRERRFDPNIPIMWLSGS